MGKYDNPIKEVKELQQRLANLISYIIFCREKGYISDITYNKLLEIINPDLYEEGANYGRKT